MTRSQSSALLSSLDSACTRVLAALEAVPAARRQGPPLAGEWSAHDIVAHLAGWARWDLAATRSLLETGSAEYAHLADVDAFNAENVAERRGRTWAELRAELQGAVRAWAELLGSLGEDDLYCSPRYRSPEWRTLAQWVEIVRDHLAEHAQALEERREGLGHRRMPAGPHAVPPPSGGSACMRRWEAPRG